MTAIAIVGETKNSGIYKITCHQNNRFYIGSSSNLTHRLRVHKNSLRRGNHVNPKLQASWDKHGDSSFSFEIIFMCPSAYLPDVEQAFITDLEAVKSGFNISEFVDSPMRGRKHSEAAKLRMSEGKKGRIVDDSTKALLSQQAQSRASATSAQMKAMWAKGRDETVAKIALANTGKKRSAESCANIGAATKAKWEQPGYRENMKTARANGKPTVFSESSLEAMKQRMIAKWKDPEYIAKQKLIHPGRKNTPETIEKMRQSALAVSARKAALKNL